MTSMVGMVFMGFDNQYNNIHTFLMCFFYHYHTITASHERRKQKTKSKCFSGGVVLNVYVYDDSIMIVMH